MLRFIKKNYPQAHVLKIADKFTSGIPDLHICINGKCIWIELKVPGNEPTKIQEYMLQKIRRAGGRTAVCHSVQEVKQFLAEIV